MALLKRDPASAMVYTIASALVLLAFAPSLWTCALAEAAIGFALGRRLFGSRLPRAYEAQQPLAGTLTGKAKGA